MENQLSRSAQYKNINRITTKHFSKIPITVRGWFLVQGGKGKGVPPRGGGEQGWGLGIP